MAEPNRTSLWDSLLGGIYQSLVHTDAVQPADLILVLAGRMERKPYGLELYRAGVAPQLVLSAGRFEVSKMASLGLPETGELLALRDRTPPHERHFFMSLDASGTQIVKALILGRGTYGEALAFRHFLKGSPARRIVVISTGIHLRRVRATYNKVFRGESVEFLYCPVPPRLAAFKRDTWWVRSESRRYVFQELIKLAGYQLVLSIPEWIARRLMRLRT